MKVGQEITCLHTVEAYYSNYGGNPVLEFKPGMKGVIASIAPKVFVMPKGIKLPSHLDRKSNFLVVDYYDVWDEKHRVGLNFCNAEKTNVRKN